MSLTPRLRVRDGMRVLVTGATRNSGLAVIRALGRAGLRPVGADDRTFPLGLRSRYSERYHVYPSMDAEGLKHVLREARPDAFLPLATWSVRETVQQRAAFAALAALNLPEWRAFETVFDRRRLAAACDSARVPCAALLSTDDALRRLERGGNEALVVVKPAVERGGARGVRYCREPAALCCALEEASRAFGDAVVQEYVPGPPSAMRTVTLVYGRGGELLARFTTRKIRSWPASGGVTAVCESTDDPALAVSLARLFEAIGWRGPAEAELKIDERDGRARLIEINPRFPGYVGFSVACGINLPQIAALAAAGREAEVQRCPPYVAGRRYVSFAPFLRSAASEIRRPGGGLRAAVASCREIAPWAAGNCRDWSDPLPRVGKLLQEIASFAARGDGRPPRP